ncbi:MFS transporter [Paractinoplanes brasiliensis]|uniref:Putative MFS family arabinose efflux permease n=1 Tax=Paractinoplanes brasiliensis TaxID=52695 RepID=A0A4R6JXX5_9ACTN|nr:MFS transporter [Actinoplanes brasiliensis]TDO41569.1 putative MFS family arabinose efflux permease [Actinoplanes brasiliensis]GID27144.1 MFS transporter [Actinoplanes brasiliensis]
MDSPWAPLRGRVFRMLWIAVLAGNVGTWMQTVGAQWLVVQEPNAATWTSLVQTVTMLPVLLLALPAGAIADVFDRRRLLLAVQVVLCLVGGALTVLTVFGLMPPPVLLVFTFLLGVGQALTLPTWQAVIPELVSRDELPAASALGAVNTNLARSAGPAVAGLLVAHVGSAAVFALNALSYGVFALALLLWRRPARQGPGHPERFGPAVRAGGRFVRYAPSVRRLLIRVILFVVPGSVVWGLLPVVARQELGLGASGYGVLLAALGVGAIAGALLMPRIRRVLSANRLIVVAGVVYAGALLVTALVPNEFAVTGVLVPAGAGWMCLVSRMNAGLQLLLPNWVRARGFGIYQVVFAGAQALGALLWGQVAEVFGLPATFVAAAAVMLLGTATVFWLPVHEHDDADRSPATLWAEPHIMLDPHPEEGPVLVTAVYRVRDQQADGFVEAMNAVRLTRLRTGATRWGLFRDGEDPVRYVEVYQVPTWEDHLRQHDGRMTGSDEEAEKRALALAEGPPEVTHLLPADNGD